MDAAELARLCHTLPLFPLPGVVLMPGAAMPLHVFEPRYRALIRDCLAGNGLLAIPQIRAGSEEEHNGTPLLYPYTAVGKIGGHQVLPDGRYNLIVHPLARVILRSDALGEGGYRVGDAELLFDSPHVPARLEAVGNRVRALVAPLIGRMGEAGSPIARALMGMPALRVAEALAPVAIQDGEERQLFLAENDPILRAEMVEAAVLAMIAQAGTREVAEA